jgi:hypothetical protein
MIHKKEAGSPRTNLRGLDAETGPLTPFEHKGFLARVALELPLHPPAVELLLPITPPQKGRDIEILPINHRLGRLLKVPALDRFKLHLLGLRTAASRLRWRFFQW